MEACVVGFCLTKLYQSRSLISVHGEMESTCEKSFIVSLKVRYLCNVVVSALSVKQHVEMKSKLRRRTPPVLLRDWFLYS